jgi:hypothetical protein
MGFERFILPHPAALLAALPAARFAGAKSGHRHHSAIQKLVLLRVSGPG